MSYRVFYRDYFTKTGHFSDNTFEALQRSPRDYSEIQKTHYGYKVFTTATTILEAERIIERLLTVELNGPTPKPHSTNKRPIKILSVR